MRDGRLILGCPAFGISGKITGRSPPAAPGPHLDM